MFNLQGISIIIIFNTFFFNKIMLKVLCKVLFSVVKQ